MNRGGNIIKYTQKIILLQMERKKKEIEDRWDKLEAKSKMVGLNSNIWMTALILTQLMCRLKDNGY